MGHEWLSRSVLRLKEAGFRVESGYPARKAAQLTDTVAAVNADSAVDGAVTGIVVSVLTPGELGLERCQAKALEALAALSGREGQWRFSGWRYESGIGCWVIELRGAPGCQIWLGENAVDWVTDFQARQEQGRRLIRPHGQTGPSGVISGRGGWQLKLTQLLPEQAQEPDMGTEPFVLKVSRGARQEIYRGCCWDSYTTRQEQEGTRIIREAFALDREVSDNGSDEL